MFYPIPRTTCMVLSGNAMSVVIRAEGTKSSPTAVGVRLVIFVGAMVLVVAAWMLARAFLRPRDVFKIQDKAISRLQFFRSFAGLVVTVMVGIHYSGQSATLKSLILHWDFILLVGGICVMACSMLFLALSNSRGALLRSFARPFLRMLIVGAFYRLVIPLLVNQPRVNKIMATNPQVRIPSIPDVLLVLAAGGLDILAIGSFYYAARYLYGAGEIHPLLGPAVTVTTATVLMIAGLLPGSAHIPPLIYLTLTIGGWLSTTILSAQEWRSIRNKNKDDKITIRNVPAKGFGSFRAQQASWAERNETRWPDAYGM